MTEQPMTDKTPISLGLMIYLVGLAVMTAGSWAWMQADVATLKQRDAEIAVMRVQLDRLTYLSCVTDDEARSAACRQMGMIR